MRAGLLICLLAISACSDNQLDQGKVIYEGTCKACHAIGINNAPIFGNKVMWSKRRGKGIEVLQKSAIYGYGLMPAKGGNDQLTEQDIRAAIAYMLSAS